MKHIDLKHAVESPGTNNFTCLLFRLILKADAGNRILLARGFSVEVQMAEIYKDECPYQEGTFGQVVDYKRIEEMVMEDMDNE